MDRPLTILDRVHVASPCDVPWADMTGDDRVRHCAQCDLDVFNLSDMTRDEAESFVRDRVGGERTCVQFYRRTDGTVMTRDCPIGIAAFRKRLGRVAAGCAAVVAGILGASALVGSLRPKSTSRIRDLRPFTAIANWIHPPPPPPAKKAKAKRTIITLGYLMAPND
jgi:hypothetical protein